MINELQKIIADLDEKFNSECEIKRYDAVNNLNNMIWLLQCKKTEMMNSPVFLQDQARAISAREEVKNNDQH